jgi:hypothetical protein
MLREEGHGMARDDQERFHAPQRHEYTSASCFNCRFNCGSLVSRLPKGSGETFGAVLQRRMSRRTILTDLRVGG